jgi:uncharacterized membrane protein YeiH
VTDPVASQAVLVLDLLGVFVFAMSGGLVAVRKDLDIFGVLVVAAATGLGGGITRDVLIGARPPAALDDWRYVVVAAAAGLVAFRFPAAIGRREHVITGFDAAGLGLFCSTGALKALDAGLDPFAAALLGLVTAVGGGVLRDVLTGRVPVVLRHEIYALPALAGAGATVLLSRLDMSDLVAGSAAFVVCFGWRMVAVRRDWNAPRSYSSST